MNQESNNLNKINAERNDKEQKEFIIILRFLLQNISLILLSVAIALVIAFLVNRYSQIKYLNSMTILVKDESGSSFGVEEVFSELSLFNTKQNIQNEIGIIRSFSLIDKTLDSVPYADLQFYRKGKFVDQELYYLNFPYIIELLGDTQYVDIPFYIRSISANKFSLVTPKAGALRTIKGSSYNKFLPNFMVNSIFKFGDTINLSGMKMILKLNPVKVMLSPDSSQGQFLSFSKSEQLYWFQVGNREQLVKKYQSNLIVSIITEKASILEIKLVGSVKEKDVDFLNKLAEVYIMKGLDEKNRMATNTINFVDRQLDEIASSLENAENALQNFRSNNNILSVSLSATQLFERLERIDQRRMSLELNEKYYNYLLNYLNSRNPLEEVTSPSAVGIYDQLLINLINQLSTAAEERRTLQQSVKIENPELRALNIRIEGIKNSLIENLKNIIKGNKISLDEVNKQTNEITSEIKKLPQQERSFLNIQRRFDFNDNLYNYLLEKKAEANIAKASNAPDNQIIDCARVKGAIQVSPKIQSNYLTAVFLGFLIPILALIINYHLSDKIRSVEDLTQNTPVPIAGVIGHSKRTDITKLSDPKYLLSDAFRSIKTNLLFQEKTDEMDSVIISVSSTIGGEGKTFVAAHLALTYATAGKKTVLLGTDFKKHGLKAYFEGNGDIGISGVMEQKYGLEHATIKSNLSDNLDIIPLGYTLDNSNELLFSKQMDNIVSQLREKYDIIVFDSSPLGLVSDFMAFLRFTDITLYIVRNNYTRVSMLKQPTELSKNGILKRAYIVLNDYSNSIDGYYQGYYYGGYYGGYYGDNTKKDILSKVKGWFNKNKA